ncbi:metallophosphoesterase family protein [Kitasatospora viridis]|uniref:3',5'-cyclic AMP phosphodiesterase CpdA n=1 Tax=Kitasatospora viridis TaxID=281105 RepID=A0A561UBX7_9ACTN|nr:metallophosphoesterase [Kitasatospora viridis]TWF96864.1 3',5'-cyclic AMP phosphodiesterase CpdA [Kitasatospora viridis]
MSGNLLAISDLHIGHPENRSIVESLRPDDPSDWLIIAGDVCERFEDIAWVLAVLRDRFAELIWAPGNHELWTHPNDPVQLRGVERYQKLVELCRRLGVHSPEDPYPVWQGEDEQLVVAPLFTLYDYSFMAPGATTVEESLQIAHDSGIVCSDEFLLHPDPYPTRGDWCRARIELTERRLGEIDPSLRTVLINHYPLVREPTRILRYPQFAQWCGTELTADWHLKYRAAAMVYGHLHIPRVTWYDGVRFEEVSVGYPREWKPRGHRTWLRPIKGPAAR